MLDIYDGTESRSRNHLFLSVTQQITHVHQHIMHVQLVAGLSMFSGSCISVFPVCLCGCCACACACSCVCVVDGETSNGHTVAVLDNQQMVIHQTILLPDQVTQHTTHTTHHTRGGWETGGGRTRRDEARRGGGRGRNAATACTARTVLYAPPLWMMCFIKMSSSCSYTLMRVRVAECLLLLCCAVACLLCVVFVACLVACCVL